MATQSLYDHYYTASDVNVTLYYPITDKRIMLDKAVGIGYSHSMSSMPIYKLGSVDPVFFSRGNSLIQGSLDIVYKSNEYMKTAISYLLDYEGSKDREAQLIDKVMKKTASKEESYELSLLQNNVVTDMTVASISNILSIFDIYIDFNNTNATTDGEKSRIHIYGVKFVNQSMNINSTDEGSLMDRYSFIAKNIK